MRKFSRLLIFVSYALLLTSCGFHLREGLNFPPQLNTLYISSATPYGSFEKYLKNILRTSDINIVDEPDESRYMLRINKHQITQSMAGISLNTQTRSYNLNYMVRYDLVHNGITVLANETVSIDQSYLTSSSQISFTDDAQMKTTIESLQQAAAEQIINRLSSQQVKELLMKQQKMTKKAKTHKQPQ